MKKVVHDLHERYVKGTPNEGMVQLVRVLLCHLTFAVSRDGLGVDQDKVRVYVSTRVVKHVYDKKPAEEYDFLVQSVHQIVKYPDCIYGNKPGKRGNYCFVKTLKNEKYLCCVEAVTEDDGKVAYDVVTFYRVRKERYLDSYELLWSWRDDEPSS